MMRLAHHRTIRFASSIGCAAFAVLLAGIFLAPAFAAGGGDKEPPFEPVVPPGQDDVMAAMLGRAAVLPGECKFDGGGADGIVIRSTYRCPTGEVVYELTHPDNGDDTASTTERFAIMLRSGDPPNGLEEALVSLIRYREPQFEWQWLSSHADGSNEDPQDGDDAE